jgi:hypothetical protein
MRYTGHYELNETKLITLIITILIMVTKELSLRYFYHRGDNDNNRIDYID